jgi:hypothetical protein
VITLPKLKLIFQLIIVPTSEPLKLNMNTNLLMQMIPIILFIIGFTLVKMIRKKKPEEKSITVLILLEAKNLNSLLDVLLQSLPSKNLNSLVLKGLKLVK